MTQHKHAELLRIAADDADAEFTHTDRPYMTGADITTVLDYPDLDWYHIPKKVEKEDKWLYVYIYGGEIGFNTAEFRGRELIGKIKLEDV